MITKHWWKSIYIHYLGYYELTYDFDFFNYAGIHRPVLLTTVPKDVKIEDITVVTDLTPDLATATVSVDVAYNVGKRGTKIRKLKSKTNLNYRQYIYFSLGPFHCKNRSGA